MTLDVQGCTTTMGHKKPSQSIKEWGKPSRAGSLVNTALSKLQAARRKNGENAFVQGLCGGIKGQDCPWYTDLTNRIVRSSRVGGKRHGSEGTNLGPHHIHGSEPNPYVTYLTLIITTCPAEGTEALESWLTHSTHVSVYKRESVICANSGLASPKPESSYPATRKSVVDKGFCWILRQRIEGKTPKLPEGKGPREIGTYCFPQGEEISVHSICVYKYIFARLHWIKYNQRKKTRKIEFKDRVRNMLNNPANENQAPGSNKILIIFLPLSTKQCGQWDNSAHISWRRWKGYITWKHARKWSESVPWVTQPRWKRATFTLSLPTSKGWRTETTTARL